MTAGDITDISSPIIVVNLLNANAVTINVVNSVDPITITTKLTDDSAVFDL